jgi:ubiquinone/menaquinone biosynthesis C-methylase UbiE
MVFSSSRAPEGSFSMTRPDGYVPAAGHDRFLALYDPVARYLFAEEATKGELIAQARLAPGHRVLDVGCGTGTLAVMIQRAHPETRVVGMDGDPKALALARKKAEAAGVAVQLDEALSYDLPYPDRSFDRVFSSMMLHHLTVEQKRRTLAEIRRVLAPNGTFHLLDFGRPVSVWDRALSHVLDAHTGQGGSALVDLLREAGFADVEELSRRGTIAGSVWHYRAAAPSTESAPERTHLT